jgi:D-alanyl-D-alanine carboxypeptidase
MAIRIVALLLGLTGVAAGQSQPTPSTPAGQVFAAWLSAFNTGDRAALTSFDAKFRIDAQPIDQMLRFRLNTGGFTLVRVEASTPTRLVALLEERDARRLARLELEVTADTPPKVVTATLRDAVRTADTPLVSLTEAEAFAAISARIDELTALDQFSGAVLVGRGGKVLFQMAAGLSHRESKTANTVETQFRNGSMNKMFTATAIMQLIEAGKLSLDDTVGKVIPGYGNTAIASRVTIRHLLTHTGGTGDFFGPEFMKNRLSIRTHGDYLAMFGSRAPTHEPGAEFRYSNLGFVLLGAIIERVSGLSYFDYVRTRIFEPAGMTSTGSLPESETIPNRSSGYMRRKDAWVPNTDALPWSGTSAGGGYSTVGDFFRFAEALQSGKLISKTSLAQMITPYRQQYGFGMVVQGEGPRRNFGHSGGAPGQNGDLRVFPDSGYVIVALSNFDPPAATRLMEFIAVRLPIAATSVPTATIVDDFESGALTGWTIDRRGSGSWFVYENGRQAPDPRQSDPFQPFNMPNPPQGKFAAVSDTSGPSMRLMYRDLKLEGSNQLEMLVFYRNGPDGLSGYSNRFIAPKTLGIDGGPSQQFRIDLLSTSAAADSMSDNDILATIFATEPGAAPHRAPSPISFDLSRWSGQTVRLRIAAVDNQGPLRAGVDDIRLLPVQR